MQANDPNLPHLRRVAEALGDLSDQLVFVGGAVAGLLVTDPLSDPVRATRDVDAVIEADRAAYFLAEKIVAARGFARDATSNVICRWMHRESGVPAPWPLSPPNWKRSRVAAIFAGLLANPDFLNVLPGLIAESQRSGLVMARLQRLSE